jgi:hypothetical protein
MLSCFAGLFDLLVLQHLEGARDAALARVRHDHLVDIAALGGDERVGEAVFVVLGALAILSGSPSSER